MAERWAALGRRIQARAADAGVRTLIPASVWEAAADPATWGPEPPGMRAVVAARTLGGCAVPAGWRGPVHVGEFSGAVVLWQPGLITAARHPPRDGSGTLAGLAPAVTVEDLGPEFGGWLDAHTRRGIRHLGGVTLEALRVAVANDGNPRRRWLRAVACLVDGRGEIHVRSDGTARITPPGFREPVTVSATELTSTDPRLARRFLGIFTWWDWLEDPDSPTGWVATTWLAAITPADPVAVRVLASRPAAGWLNPEPVVLALRAAGHPTGWPPSEALPSGAHPDPDPRTAPVLWWRRVLGRLVAHPDRLRAVEEAAAAWVRLAAGH